MVGRRGISHRRKRRGRRPDPAVHQDLVQRKFTAAGSDLLWCTDITEHPTRGGKVYCAAVLDVFTRQVVGWSVADHMRSELVVDALQMAIWRRRPEPGTIVHADRGSQYTSWVFGHRLRDAGLLGSMGRVASSVDNSMIESLWSTMQRELLDTRTWDSPEQLGSAIFEWIEAWYNPRRRHTSLRMLSPADYEHHWKNQGLHTAAHGAA
jgi:transposase InsO family protein